MQHCIMKHQIMQTCIIEHHIMQHCIMEHQIMQICIMGRHIMQHCILKRHIMQACVAQKCAHQTFGALDIKMVDGPIDRTTSLLCQSLQSVIRQLENCNGDSNSIDTIMYRVDWLYGCIIRYSVIHHGFIWEEVIPNLYVTQKII